MGREVGRERGGAGEVDGGRQAKALAEVGEVTGVSDGPGIRGRLREGVRAAV